MPERVWPARLSRRFHIRRHLSEKLASQRDDVAGLVAAGAKFPINALCEDGEGAKIAASRVLDEGDCHVLPVVVC